MSTFVDQNNSGTIFTDNFNSAIVTYDDPRFTYDEISLSYDGGLYSVLTDLNATSASFTDTNATSTNWSDSSQSNTNFTDLNS